MLYLVVVDNIYHSHWLLTKDVFCQADGPRQRIWGPHKLLPAVMQKAEMITSKSK